MLPLGDDTAQTLTIVEKTNGQMRSIAHSACMFVKLIGKYGWEA